MLPNVNDLFLILETKAHEDKLNKNKIFKSVIESVLSDIYDYPKKFSYSKFLSKDEILSYMDDLKVDYCESKSEYFKFRNDIVKFINSNTDLYCYLSKDGISISWDCDDLLIKKESDINFDYELALCLRIDVDELQRLSFSEISKQKEKEIDYFNIYIKEIISNKILSATSSGETQCTVYSSDIDSFIKLNGFCETRSGKLILSEIASYIDSETVYLTKLVKTKFSRDAYIRQLIDYKFDSKLKIYWDIDSLELKKSKVALNSLEAEFLNPDESDYPYPELSNSTELKLSNSTELKKRNIFIKILKFLSCCIK